jgi:replicative DNA helicase
MGISVLALCQLSRKIDERGDDARPKLSDLKESGGLEEQADIVWMLWRKTGEGEQQTINVTEAEILVAKNRMLPEATVKCGFHGRRFEFVDLVEGDR